MWCRIIDISVTEFSDQEMKQFLKGQREMCQAVSCFNDKFI